MNYRMRLPAEQMVQRIAATARSLEASVWYISTSALYCKLWLYQSFQ